MPGSFKHLKEQCAGCERQNVEMTKEHVFPQWLILRTRTNSTGIRWGDKPKIPALAATLPLCGDCNRIFGEQLETPTSLIFNDLEAGLGLSDCEAELLVRWMWKIKGLFWIAHNPGLNYTSKYTLRQRVLFPIDEIRSRIVLAVALIENLHPDSDDLPMGMDSFPQHDAIFVSGVFSMIAMMAVLEEFTTLIPAQFDQYKLSAHTDSPNTDKVFFPSSSFSDDVEAVGITMSSSMLLSQAHDELALQLQSMLNPSNTYPDPKGKS